MLDERLIQTADKAADLARTITTRYFRSTLNIDSKQDKSPVTIADQETEAAVKKFILEQYPEHGFFGEESGQENSDAEWQWILDPIDGTKCFASGKPTFGTLIALLHQSKPVLGIIDHVMLDERWVGIAGQTTTCNGKPCQTSSEHTLASASIYTTTLDMFDDQTFPRYEKLSRACQFRVFGGDSYCYGLLSSGYTHLVCEADLKPYDFLALAPVVEGAGGIITDWQGKALTRHSGDQVLASANSNLHEAALELLNR